MDGALIASRTRRAAPDRSTKDEWRLFTAANPALRLMSQKSFVERVERLAGEAAPQMLAAYDEGSPFERFNALMTDKGFTPRLEHILRHGVRISSG